MTSVQNEHLKSHSQLPLEQTNDRIKSSSEHHQTSFSSKKSTPTKKSSLNQKLSSPIKAEPPIKQIDKEKSLLSSSSSSVESFSAKLEKSGLMSPDDEALVINTHRSISASVEKPPAVKKRETIATTSPQIVLKKQTYSSSSDDDDF